MIQRGAPGIWQNLYGLWVLYAYVVCFIWQFNFRVDTPTPTHNIVRKCKTDLCKTVKVTLREDGVHIKQTYRFAWRVGNNTD